MAWRHIHHVERVDGDPDVLCLLCSQCHKKVVHGGYIVVTGRAPRFVFTLRDGRPARLRGARGDALTVR